MDVEDGVQRIDLLKNVGYLPYSKIYHQLKIQDCFSDTSPCVNEITQILLYLLLIYSEHRFLNEKESSTEDLIKTLHELLKARDTLIAKINTGFDKNSTLIFYDLPAFVFGADVLNKYNSLVTRYYEVKLGVYVDENNIPVSYELSNNNHSIETTSIDLANTRRIVVSDSSKNTISKLSEIREAHNGYIYKQNLSISDQEKIAFALKQSGWKDILDDEGKLKSRIKERIALVPTNKEKTEFAQERQIFICNKGRAKKLIKDGIPKELQKSDLTGYYIICTNVVGSKRNEINRNLPKSYSYYSDDGLLVLNRAVPATEIVKIFNSPQNLKQYFQRISSEVCQPLLAFDKLIDGVKVHFLLTFLSLVLERHLEKEIKWSFPDYQIRASLERLYTAEITKTKISLIHSNDITEAIFSALKLNIKRSISICYELQNIIDDKA